MSICCPCGEPIYFNCQGQPRCAVCDPPCLCCSDGPGFGGDDDCDAETRDLDLDGAG